MTLREALWDAAVDRQKLVACEALPDRAPGAAQAELAKTFGPSADRGDTVLTLFDAILRFGDREKLRAYFDSRLRPGVETTLRELERVKEIQFELFDPLVRALEDARRLRDQLEEEVQRRPLSKRGA